jgi:TetR/AcrR family transcriptional regulator, cholesterol catabolism regulator
MDNRDRIIEGAAQLFRTHGIKSVTMDSLAAHLGMSKRTIYEIFSDKDEILLGVLKWMAEKQRELVKKVLDDSENAIAAIFKLLEVNRDHFQEMSPAFQSDLRRFHQDVLMRKYDKCEMPDYKNTQMVIERGIKEKHFRKDIDPDLANRCMDYLAKAIINGELYPYDQFSRRDVIRSTVINYMRGISTPEGIELINKFERKF